MRFWSVMLAPLAIVLPQIVAAEEPRHLEAAGTQFPYSEAGEGEIVLFVHGAFSDHRTWDPFRDPIAEQHRFMAYTQRGFGVAEWPEEPGYARDVHEDDLIAVLDALGEPVHLVGWSYGGPIVLQAALDRPELVRSVVIFEPTFDEILAGDPQFELTLARWENGWGPVVVAAQQGNNEEALTRALEYVFGLPEDGFETLPEGARSVALDNAHTIPKVLRSPAPTPMTCEDVAEIETPVLIVLGTETLPFFEAVSRETAACLPNGRLEEMSGIGHGGPVQAKDAFADKVLAFIEEADAS